MVIFVSFSLSQDGMNHRICVLDKQHLGQVQVIEGLNNPFGVAVDEDNVYVSEQTGHCVRAFNKTTGAQLWKTGGGQVGNGEGQFNQPRQVAVDGHHIFVADYYNKRICVLRKDTGEHVRFLGTSGEFGWPAGLALDAEQPQHLYISDYNGKIIHPPPPPIPMACSRRACIHSINLTWSNRVGAMMVSIIRSSGIGD